MLSWRSLAARYPWSGLWFWIYLFLILFGLGTAINDADPDLWQRFAIIDYFFKTGHFPAGDTFGYLGVPEVRPDHEWGSAVLLYGTWLLGGGTGIVILKLVTLGTTLTLVIVAGMGRRSPTVLHAIFYCLVIMALLSSFLSTVRSEASTHVLFALWVLWFQQERQGVKVSAWAYAGTMMLWANLHGGFILGLAWLGAITLLEFFNGGNWQRRLGIMALCLAATLVNPFGYRMWEGVYRVLFIPRTGFEEWEPVPWLSQVGYFAGYKVLALWGVVIVGLHLCWRGWKRCDRATVVLFTLFLIPSLTHARYTSLFAIVAGGLLPPLFPPETALQDIREWKPWLHRVVIRSVLLILPLVYVCRQLPANAGFHLRYPPATYPVGAIDYLQKTGVQGNLLVDFNAGSYAMWKLRPRMRVSIDTRYEVGYDYPAFEKVHRFFAAGENWQNALRAPEPDAILVNRAAPVYAKLLAEPGWVQTYQDVDNAIFLPQSTPVPKS